MAASYVADLGRAALAAPRAILALPGSARLRRRLLLIVLAALVLCAAYMLWFRHSSFVAVEKVEVTGLTFAEQEIAAALDEAAKGMTTLDADVSELERAVRAFPTVAAVSIDPDFPHRLVVEVTERPPVATVGAGEGVAVAGDGTVLSGVAAGNLELPAIEAENAPASGRLEGLALAQAEVLGAAPAPLRPAIEKSGAEREHGIVIGLTGDIELRFGDSRDAAEKWAAVAAILADPKLDELSYIDVRLPGRPAVGGAPLPAGEQTEPEVAAPIVPADPAATVDPAAPIADPAAAPAPDPAAASPPATTPAPTTPAPATSVAGATAAP